jgi:hypothetical protein
MLILQEITETEYRIITNIHLLTRIQIAKQNQIL